MSAIPELLRVADSGNHGSGSNRTNARHFRDLLAQHGSLHERLDRRFDQMDAFLTRLQVLQHWGDRPFCVA
ncbi:hypothetical protein [Cupriavidus pinatubonensis]|uniref:hypothetical protein n=1 Tax=Cupriavidus pinatubonensis TaxID=248026 RepID=UPI0035940460